MDKCEEVVKSNIVHLKLKLKSCLSIAKNPVAKSKLRLFAMRNAIAYRNLLDLWENYEKEKVEEKEYKQAVKI